MGIMDYLNRANDWISREDPPSSQYEAWVKEQGLRDSVLKAIDEVLVALPSNISGSVRNIPRASRQSILEVVLKIHGPGCEMCRMVLLQEMDIAGPCDYVHNRIINEVLTLQREAIVATMKYPPEKKSVQKEYTDEGW